jgi:NhaP-type Na+/H+ or K+/H+ antiporter
MANQKTVPLTTIVEFKETLGLLLLGLLFILLAALVVPSDVVDLGFAGLGFVALLVFVARPLGVALCSLGSSLSWRERAVVAWMAPRGIIAASTASTFSLKLVADHVAGADKIVPVTFLVITCTVLVYAFTAPPLARALGVATR